MRQEKDIPIVQAPFVPQTIINSLPQGVQIIVQFAPQVNIVVGLTLEQMKDAMERSLQLRKDQALLNPEAVRAMMARKDLKV